MGWVAPATSVDGGNDGLSAAKESGLPTTSPPEVVQVDEQDNQVTLGTQPFPRLRAQEDVNLDADSVKTRLGVSDVF